MLSGDVEDGHRLPLAKRQRTGTSLEPTQSMPFIMIILLILATIILVLTAGILMLFVRARILPLALSVLGGLGISALLTGGGGPTVVTTLIAAIALLMVFESRRKPLLRRQRTRQRPMQHFDIEAVATTTPATVAQTKATRRRTAAVPSSEPALDDAWAALASHADWAVSRVAVVKESCRLFLGTTDHGAYDSDAADLAVRIRRRIPEHVAECLTRCEHTTASERRAILDTCLFTLEKVAADADRQRARLLGQADSEMHVQRRHLTRSPQADPFSLD
jgi:membrane protein implicated in regulation of membrane protease activity